MLLTRKIGSFLRGKATRGQVVVAAVLGGMLGFVPGFFLPSDLGGGFLQGPGLILSLFFLAFVLPANLGIFGMVTVVAKLCSFPLLPVSFAVGRALIDGPLQPVFRFLVNAPVTAWFGLDHYATTGGVVLGLFFGTAVGLGLARALMTMRHRMARLEEGSQLYQQNAGKLWVRFLSWVLLGKGKNKKVTWQEMASAQGRTRPVRLVGVALVAVVVAGLCVFQSHYSTPLLTSGLRASLAAANGATVDLGAAELDLAGGSLRIRDLAIADSSALDRDLFRATSLEGDIDTGALLRKRFVVDRLRVAGAASGKARATPGVLLPRPPEPPPPPPTGPAKTLEDYLKDAKLWQQRIAQARDWIDWFCGSGAEAPAPRTPEQQQKRIEIDAEQYGLAKVTAEHLREDLPLVWIRAIDVEGIACERLPVATLDLHVHNWSTNAWLLAEPPKLEVKSPQGDLAFAFTGPSKNRKGAAIDLSLKDMTVDSVFAQLKASGAAPLHGGTMDIAAAGSLLARENGTTSIALPLSVTLHHTTFALAGSKETAVEHLVLPIGVGGTIEAPTITFDAKVLADALVKAGKQELANFVEAQAGQLLGSVPGAEGLIDPKKSPEQMLKDAQKAAEDAAKKAAEDAAKKAAEDAAKKGLEQGLKGLLPGRKNG